MAASALYNYIKSLMGRGKVIREIWQFVKKHIKLRNSRDDTIRNTIAKINVDKDAAKNFNRAKAGATIDKNFLGGNRKAGDAINVAFHFYFNFPSGSSSGKVGRVPVHLSIDVPLGATKGEINKQIRDMIREWMESHYGARPEGRGGIYFSVDSIN